MPPRYTVTMFKDGIWNVRQDVHNLIFEGTEAEAHIIAFALNAVAEGAVLSRGQEMVMEGRNKYEDYTGPTEGVAP